MGGWERGERRRRREEGRKERKKKPRAQNGRKYVQTTHLIKDTNRKITPRTLTVNTGNPTGV
jgi:hypothetical protein